MQSQGAAPPHVPVPVRAAAANRVPDLRRIGQISGAHYQCCTSTAEAERQRTAATVEAAAALQKLLASCSVSGSEAAALGAAGTAARLSAAGQQLASVREQVQQQLGPPTDGTAGAGDAPPDAQLRALLAALLLDAAAAKKQQNELLGRTLSVTAQLQGLEERITSPTLSPQGRRAATLPPPL